MKYSMTMRAIVAALSLSCGFVSAQQNTTYNYLYDANGNLTQITDPLGHVTTQTFDALNRLSRQVQPAATNGGTQPAIGYTYDGLDQLTKVTDPRNLVTSYAVDGLGNQSQLTSPDTGGTNKTYDAAGNLKTVTDARGKTTTYTYDALNRLKRIDYASGTPTIFTYDQGPNSIGRLSSMTDETGQTTYSYDVFGHITTKTWSGPYKTTTINYAWGTSGNANGKLVAITYPSGNRINIAYDSAGRINSLVLNPTNSNGQGTNTSVSIPIVTNIGYAPLGGINSWTWGNSTDTNVNTFARGIDLDGRITSYPLGYVFANGTSRTVNYDAASRITGVTHTGMGTGANAPANYDQIYSFDNLDRLTGFTSSYTNQSYGYDLTGNRIGAVFGSNSYTDTIAAGTNRMSSMTGPVAKTFTYDTAGNVTNDGRLTYSYSDRGKLRSVFDPSNPATGGGFYFYNGLNQRAFMAKGTSAPSTYFSYDEAGHLIGEYNQSTTMLEETVYLGDMPVAVLKQVVTGTSPATTTQTNLYYVYADHINTPRVITDTNNQMVWRWDNTDPWGYARPNENPSGLGTFTYNLRFPGQYYDNETGLVHNGYRDYDANTGRYVQSDPIGLNGGINTYAYVEGNPLSYVDPKGLMGQGNYNFSNGPNMPADQSHEYTWKVFRCMGDCSAQTMKELLCNPAPGVYPNKPTQTGDVNDVHVGPVDLGNITTVVSPDTNTTWNLTMPGHMLHPGWVRRDVVVEGGATWVVTTGGGTGSYKWLNEKLAPIVWGGRNPIPGGCGCDKK